MAERETFDTETGQKILEAAGKNFYDVIDEEAAEVLDAAGIKDPSAKQEYDARIAVIKKNIPLLLNMAEVESTLVTREKAADITGRIYARYLFTRLGDRGMITEADGEGALPDKQMDRFRALCRGEIKLSDF